MKQSGIFHSYTSRSWLIALWVVLLGTACEPPADFDPANPGRGPGELVGNGAPVSDGNFAGGNDTLPTARAVTPPEANEAPNCDAACRSYCAAQTLANPVHRGLCPLMWGVGLTPHPIDNSEACRRLYIDMLGRTPTEGEIATRCQGKPWGDVVKELINTEEFVFVNQRNYADLFHYTTESANVEAIYDLDALVGKLEKGLVSYDQFAAVAAAHPAYLRRFATPEDMAEAVFTHFMGRPPFDYERADFSRLYQVWRSSYIDHKPLGVRLPDAFVGYACLNDKGEPDEALLGQCTSTLFGLNQVVLKPDYRAIGTYGELEMWQGLIRPDEWKVLQTPGRALSTSPLFWETAVERIVVQYLGYDLAALAPEVRSELVAYLLQYNGDIRSVHYAVATSVAYLQSSRGEPPTLHKWTVGPRKQMISEDWLASVANFADTQFPLCDHRISRPDDFIAIGSSAGKKLVEGSRWDLRVDGRVEYTYVDIARGLGGCPVNAADSRFRITSILTTSTQLGLANQICDPRVQGAKGGKVRAEVEKMLPGGVTANAAMSAATAESIGDFQSKQLLGRAATAEEKTTFREVGTACAAANCSAEEFARVSCFALLSSAELLFY